MSPSRTLQRYNKLPFHNFNECLIYVTLPAQRERKLEARIDPERTERSSVSRGILVKTRSLLRSAEAAIVKMSENAHIVVGTILLAVCVYFYINAVKKDSLLIDSFEGKIGMDTVDYGSSPNSSVAVRAADKFSRCGSNALQLDYTLKASGYVYCARGYGLHYETDSSTWATGRAGWLVPPDQIQWDRYGAFSIYLRSDQAVKVAIDLKDAGGELWRRSVTIRGKGWEVFQIPFNKFSVRADWQPPQAKLNRKMDFPMTSFQLEPKTPGEGTLYIDCAKLVEL